MKGGREQEERKNRKPVGYVRTLNLVKGVQRKKVGDMTDYGFFTLFKRVKSYPGKNSVDAGKDKKGKDRDSKGPFTKSD